MGSLKVAVLGGGVAGLSASMALARDGHRVTLFERDPVESTSPQDAVGWERKGIPHFLQPHVFMPRGRKEMMEQLPDVYAALIAAGAHDIDLRAKLPGGAEDGDEDLQFLGVRRPVIEWALRQAVLERSGVEVVAGAHVNGIVLESGRFKQVIVEGGSVDADIAVDAMGRRSPMQAWLEQQGYKPAPRESSDCGVIYYCRYYKTRPGRELPDGPWLLSPRGDLGYMGYASFPGDNDTFAALLAMPTGVPELKIVKDERAFESAVARIPSLHAWADPEHVDPITPVMPMAGLQNGITHYEESIPAGIFPIGDAFCHTDPVLALGLSFSLIHGSQVARALREHDDVGDAFASYAAATTGDIRERYDFATALDDQRHRMWAGDPVDFTHRTGAHALFTMVAAGAVAMVDPDVFRTFVRRIGLLDGLQVLDDDVAMQERIEKTFGEMLAHPRPPQGPALEEMLAVCQAALGAQDPR